MGIEKVQSRENIVHLSRHFGASYMAMYYRLMTEGKVDPSADDYEEASPVNLARRLGYAPSSYEYGNKEWPLEEQLPQRYIELVRKALAEGAISKRRAAEVLGHKLSRT